MRCGVAYMGTVKPGAERPTPAEMDEWKQKPHKFLSEASKLSASSCSAFAYARAQLRRNCFWCGLKEDDEIHRATKKRRRAGKQ